MKLALSVLDMEAAGEGLRKTAVYETAMKFDCGKRTVEEALSQHEDGLKALNSLDLDWLRGLRS
jgi:hypothetical protein